MTGHLIIIKKKLIPIVISVGLSIVMIPTAMAHELVEESSATAIEQYVKITEFRVSGRRSTRSIVSQSKDSAESAADSTPTKTSPGFDSGTRLYLLYHALMYYE